MVVGRREAHFADEIDPEGDIRVSIATGSEIVCEGEVWRDEMWRIFMEYLRQGEAVLFAVSVGGTVGRKHYSLPYLGKRCKFRKKQGIDVVTVSRQTDGPVGGRPFSMTALLDPYLKLICQRQKRSIAFVLHPLVLRVFQ